jgi:hypothetical protein
MHKTDAYVDLQYALGRSLPPGISGSLRVALMDYLRELEQRVTALEAERGRRWE